MRYAFAIANACRAQCPLSSRCDSRTIQASRPQATATPQIPINAPNSQAAAGNHATAVENVAPTCGFDTAANRNIASVDASGGSRNTCVGTTGNGFHARATQLKMGVNAAHTTAADKTQWRNAADRFRENRRTVR